SCCARLEVCVPGLPYCVQSRRNWAEAVGGAIAATRRTTGGTNLSAFMANSLPAGWKGRGNGTRRDVLHYNVFAPNEQKPAGFEARLSGAMRRA
ncbi:MAG: hypothetical protein ACREIV_15815, partial [Planctomycetaceae bacterium]